MDFVTISVRKKKDPDTKEEIMEIYPKFLIPRRNKSTDLMIRGGDFYAVWVEENGLWSTDEGYVTELIDKELDKYVEKNRQYLGTSYRVAYMHDADSGIVDKWHKYCQKQLRDSFHMLDEKLVFSNTVTTKEDYASKRLSYPLEKGDTSAYDKLMSVLYSEEERHKIEWAIGAVVAGESKHLQKFMVLYGAAGTGKSTVLNIMQQLFDGYYTSFSSQSLGSANSAFALEPFKDNPLVGIEHDGDLSRIETNTRLNSLVSHEKMTVNAKFEKLYSANFNCFLFMGTNKPVKITDGKSGLLRRLIDVTPSGNKLSTKEYRSVTNKIKFELGAIAYHCKEVFLENPEYYNNYIPVNMLGASNDFYNFVLDSYHIFFKDDEITGKAAYALYTTYCEEVKDPYPMKRRLFLEELKNYFKNYSDRGVAKDGTRVRRLYSGFRTDIFEERTPEKPEKESSWIVFDGKKSTFDEVMKDCPAQYANAKETPSKSWAEVTTKLSDLNTSRIHYVQVPPSHIVIDFDLKDENGNKSLERNLEEASKWVPTYAEVSKGGQGIHLHYDYSGDPTKLALLYATDIEIKVQTGNSALRRRLSKFNSLPIATIGSGLPLKGEKKVVKLENLKNEKALRALIEKNLRKEIHKNTSQSINFIVDLLDEAYESGMHYDVRDLAHSIVYFAGNSTNQSERCLKAISGLHYHSEDVVDDFEDSKDERILFFDVEVFPNLCVVCWKIQGENNPVHSMVNPSPQAIEKLLKFRLVGFNCRRYDNHILYAILLGKNNEELYQISRRIINGDKDAFFGGAYNISYTDIYDFSSKKQSLKKYEIEIGIHHQELGLPWDEPVPEDKWDLVVSYCKNDVLATEAVFNSRKADWTARQILSDVAGSSVNDTTNSLTTKIIFGQNRAPQDRFNYRNMGDESQIKNVAEDFTTFDSDDRPIFPGYKYDHGVSTYRGEVVGEGGYVYAEPGIYTNVALLDIASMHPSSIVAENLFGSEYTSRFNDILQARIEIKHGNFDKAKTMLGGKLAKYLGDESTAKDLAQALKIAINSVYGLTSASFDNPFRDKRNKDNIVAKRGALFMINLKHEVQSRGFTVAHIKTDSIKIPNATPEIIDFVTNYGRMYGYNFEHEETYDRMCLVNDAVYIARYSVPHINKKTGEEIWWTATGTQFQVPYVFKKLFSREPLTFEDFCETKSVTSAIYLDMNEGLPDVRAQEKELNDIRSKYRRGFVSDTTVMNATERLEPEIAKGHNYIFIGKVGLFCPMKPGAGGGVLVRENNTGGYSAVTGTKGYRWLEAETVKDLGLQDMIDESYYVSLANDAVETISKYGDFNDFVNEDHLATISEFMNKPEGISDDEVPFD